MKTTLRNIFLGSSEEDSVPGVLVRGVASTARGMNTTVEAPAKNRQFESKAVEQFLQSLQGESLRVLNLTATCQENLDTLSSLGHKQVPDDFLYMLDECFGEPGDFYENQSDPKRQDLFMRQCLQFDDWTFEGALVWDSLEYLKPELLTMTLDHLFGLLMPGSLLLATFHTQASNGRIPAYTYRMLGGRFTASPEAKLCQV